MPVSDINTAINTAPIGPAVASGPAPDANKPDLSRLRKMLDDFRNNMEEARTRQTRDGDYYDGYQLDAKQLRELRKRGQPAIAFNYIQPAVNGTIGVAARGKTDPRAFPRNPQDTDAADVASDVLRYVSDKSRFQKIKLECLKDMLVPGCTAAIVELGDDDDILINPIRWEEFFYDPRSRRNDFKDAAYLGIAKWVYADALEAQYPEMGEDIAASVTGNAAFGGPWDAAFEDRPEWSAAWVDKKLRRLMVVEVYYLDAAQSWLRAVYCVAGVLEHGPSPYVDDKKHPICPIEAVAAFKDRQNQVYGIVRSMIDPQDEINKRRSKALHLMSVRQIQAISLDIPPIDADTARKEVAKPDGVIPFGYQVVPEQDRISGQIALLQDSVGFLQRLAPIPSLVGRADTGASGRAQLVQSQAGMTELALVFEGFTDWEMRVYRQAWNRCGQFWQDEKWIRVTDEEDAPKFIQINKPIIQEVPQLDPATGQVVMVPTVVGVENQLAEMDVDIIVDSVPDTANVQQEQFDSLMKLLQSNPAWAQQVPFKVALSLSSIQDKRRIKGELEAFQKEQAEATQGQQETAKRAADAKIAKDEAGAKKDNATAVKTEIEATNDAMDGQARANVLSMTGGLPTQPEPPMGMV